MFLKKQTVASFQLQKLSKNEIDSEYNVLTNAGSGLDFVLLEANVTDHQLPGRVATSTS